MLEFNLKLLKSGALTLSIIALMSAPVVAMPSDPGPSEEDVPSDLDLHFQDEGDDGDDIWAGGCHWHWGDKECSAAKMFFSGDYCNDYLLFEWTDDGCHEPGDDKEVYDCREQCDKGETGTCVTIKDHCGKERDSAKCECTAKGKK